MLRTLVLAVRVRFGLLQPLMMACSTLAMLLVFGGLVSLWTWTTGDDPTSLRSRVLHHNWTKSVIAVCSAVLRMSMAVQLGTACVMLATLAFEADCVLLRDAAAMSMYRFAACAPWGMASPIWRGARRSRNFTVLALVVLLSAALATSQLLSAALLMDLDGGYVRGPIETQRYARQIGPLMDVAQRRPFAPHPPAFFRFAERTGDQTVITENNTTGRALTDTGATLRAFPELLNATDRESLLYYHGRGGLMEAHALCVSPDIDSLSYIEPNRLVGRVTSSFLHSSVPELASRGSFQWNADQAASDLALDVNCTLGDSMGVNFCPLRSPTSHACPGFPTPCLLAPTNAWFLFIDEPPELWTIVGDKHHPVDDDSAALVRALYGSRAGFGFDGTDWTSKTVRRDASINATTNATTTADYRARLSLCVVATGNTMATVEAAAEWRAVEPVLGSLWAKNVSSTTAIRAQHSAALPHAARGVMDLLHWSYANYSPFTEVIPTIRGGFGRTSDNPPYGESLEVDEMSQAYLSIVVRNVWNSSRTPVAGVQTLFSVLTSRIFLDELAIPAEYWRNERGLEMTILHRTVQLTRRVEVPIRTTGLSVAAAILTLHLAAVVVVVVKFAGCGGPKFLDQAWLTVAQLHVGEPRTFLDDVGICGDREVAHLSAAAKHWHKVVRITKNDGIVVNDPDAGVLLGRSICNLCPLLSISRLTPLR